MEEYKYICGSDKKFVKKIIKYSEVLPKDHVMIRPLYIGICGSDLLELETSTEEEIHLGHEWVGEVIECGSSVINLKNGDTVTSSSHIGCGTCGHCQIGDTHKCLKAYSLGKNKVTMFSSSVALPERSLVKLDSSPVVEHVLYECLSIAKETYSQLQKISAINKGDKVLIIGAGTIGLLVAKYLQKNDIEITIADKRSSRVKNAKAMKIKSLPIQAMLLDHSFAGSFQTIIDCSSISGGDTGALKYYQYFVAESGKIMIVCKYRKSDELPIYILANKRCVISSVASTSIVKLREVIAQDKDIVEDVKSAIITSIYNENQINEAFEESLDKNGSCKVIVKMGHDESCIN